MTEPAQPTSLLRTKLHNYGLLMRVDKPIGTYLVLWPTLWALWVASQGTPPLLILMIFIAGVFLTRSAGCAINDYADRHIDGHVKRTSERPIPAGKVSAKEALVVFAVLMLVAFLLVLLTNRETVMLSVGGLLLAACYPFMKRYTHLPQVVLGAAFAWAVPMAFSATLKEVPQHAWLIYLATLLWTVAYDTMYGMVDRDDDLRIGVKSTAILFARLDKFIVALLQIATLATLATLGSILEMGLPYYCSLLITAGFFVYQQYLIRNRERQRCFEAFLNNHYVGLIVFIGILLNYLTL